MFKNITIRGRMILLVGLFIVLWLITSIFAINQINTVGNLTDSLYQHPFLVTKALNNADINIVRMHREMREMVLLTDLKQIEDQEKIIDGLEKDIFELLNTAKDLFLGDKQKFEDLITSFSEWKPIRDEVILLLKSGEIEKAAEITVEKGEKYKLDLEEEVNNLLEFAYNKALEFNTSARTTTKNVTTIVLWLTIISLLIIGIFSFYIVKYITTQINNAVEVTNQLGKGNLDVSIEITSKDEIGKLLESLQKAITSYKKIAIAAEKISTGDLTTEIEPLSDKDKMGMALSNMIQSLRKQIKEIIEGVNVLSTAANQISTSTTQLHASSAETSSTVAQTTASVEEAKQTVQLSSEKAKYVSDNAKNAEQVSQKGKEAVNKTIEVMSQIKTQMESVAENVVNLSEQSQSIGEIISTVNEIAERSNLLAVNASIEAAKAGEQGRGFTVVAQEVKNLAEQSKKHTVQIRSILNGIQKAISTTVLSIEQGSKAVDLGAKQSVEAGDTIQSLAEFITESAQAALQIAASSQQQLAGMTQITTAVENIKQASNQNAASSKQLEVSSANLKNLGEKLQEITKMYKL